MTDETTTAALRQPLLRTDHALAALIAVQVFCAAFFLGDVLGDFRSIARADLGLHYLALELVAVMVLIAGIGVEIVTLLRMRQRQARDARTLRVASGALHDLVEEWFADWRLTAAESDVAMFTLKGLSIAEIAGLRGSAEGTVKAQLNAIYRKAGVSGRAQLLGLIVEELMVRPLVTQVAGSPLNAGNLKRSSV